MTRTIHLILFASTLAVSITASAATKRYLIQFKSQATYFATAQSLTAFNNPLAANGSFITNTEMKLLGTSAAVTKNLNHLQMMVVSSEDAAAIESLKAHPEIAFVEEEIFHPAPEPIVAAQALTPMDASTVVTDTNIPMPWGISAVHAPEAWAVTRGAGARVMVLDTGIDGGHPALQGQVEAAQNFTDGDPADVTDLVGHGSHVSGTILASGANSGLIGVAPEAKVLMGKVCTGKGCSSVGIASGLDWALQQKVDVVNMSLGGPIMSNGEALAVIAAEQGGVMVVAASGNDGKPAVSYPGAMKMVLGVGAVDQNLQKAPFSNWGPELGVVGPGVNVYSSVPRGTGRISSIDLDLGNGLTTIKSAALAGTPAADPITNDVVFANLGKPEDFAAVNVAGKFALVSRGVIAFKDKVTNAIAAKAAGIIVFDNAPGLASGTITTDGSEVAIPAILIEQAVGQAAQAQLAAGNPVRATMGVLKSNYAYYQGTSMATPHVTGVAALVRAANKSLTPDQVRQIMKETATPLTPNDQNQLGSGMVNAQAAVNRAASFNSFLKVAN